jgi:holin-like protein
MSSWVGGITWLLVFQCAGEALARGFALPVPGPVLGLVLLFIALSIRGIPEGVAAAADGLARHLSLLFVPAGVGVISYAAPLAAEWLPIAMALVVSTALTLAATALTFRWLARRTASSDADLPHAG